MDMPRRLGAEFFGTFWLTFAGCGSAVLAAGFPSLGIGFLGVSFAFGLTVLTMAYAVGHISGGHFNCAVTIGLWAGGRFKAADVVPYIIAQVVGAIAAAGVLYVIASGKPDWIPGGFASNGYGDLSPGKYNIGSCFLIEVLATFFFLYVIIGTTSKGAAVGFAGIPIGLCLNSHPSLPDSSNQRLGQSGAKHRPRTVCRRRVCRSALAVLAGAHPRRGDRRSGQSLAASNGRRGELRRTRGINSFRSTARTCTERGRSLRGNSRLDLCGHLIAAYRHWIYRNRQNVVNAWTVVSMKSDWKQIFAFGCDQHINDLTHSQ